MWIYVRIIERLQIKSSVFLKNKLANTNEQAYGLRVRNLISEIHWNAVKSYSELKDNMKPLGIFLATFQANSQTIAIKANDTHTNTPALYVIK